MISTNFGSIRTFLLDPSPKGCDNRTIAKTACLGVKIIFALSLAYDVFSIVSAPWTIPVAIGSCILNREILLIANNFESIMTTVNASALLPKWFIESLLKDTWIVGPIFKDLF